MRVLLVDDDDGFRDTLRGVLCRPGRAVEVDEASDGPAGLRLVAQRIPDAVVMDITMPGMSGLEATRALKASWPELPVIVLTVHDEPVYERTARAAGADAFLLKKTAATTLWPTLQRLASPEGDRGDSGRDLGRSPHWRVRWRPI
jgi:DNA-binding NarL/FixJ family response regulator